ncbi:MAG: hypothetical protein SCARUB_05036, partial [Candidatus Scalindua rubra]
QLYNLAIFKGKFENRRFSFNNLAEPEPIRHSSFFGSGSARLGYLKETEDSNNGLKLKFT